MSMSYLFLVAILWIFQSSHASFDSSNLHRALDMTTHFFEQLIVKYESQPATPELYEKIDREVEGYVRKVMKSADGSRGKRQLNVDKDIEVFDGLEDVPGLALSDAIDVTFFVRRNGTEQRWYAATLNSSDITLFQLHEGSFVRVGCHNLKNGSRIISHSYEESTILVIQRYPSDTHVFRLTQIVDCIVLNAIQTLDTPNVIHTTLWRAMKRIYLAVASIDDLTIYEWLGEHFDHTQTTKIRVDKIFDFQTEGLMHLLAIHGSRTFVLKFVLQSKKFVVVQKLVGAVDATCFHVEKEHLIEQFVAVTGESSTIIYKRNERRWIPFQRLGGGKKIRSFTRNGAMILFIVENRLMRIYQYDGWKFVDIGITVSGIFDAIPIELGGEQFLAIRTRTVDSGVNNNFIDDRERNIDGNVNGIVDDTSNDYDPRIFGAKDDRFGLLVWNFGRIEWKRRKSWRTLKEETDIWCRKSLEKARRVPADLPQLPETIRIQRGHIQKLQTHEINNRSAEEFANLSDRWQKMVSETMTMEKEVRNYVSTVNPIFTNVRAKNVRLNCTTRCQATKMKTAVTDEFLERLRRYDNVDQNMDLRTVKVSFIDNFPCPVPDPKFREATVTGLVNGIPFEGFVHDVMKVTGDQELYGPHTFANLQVVNAKIPLDIASNHTRNGISALTIEAEELYIKAGGLLLPLNGGPTTMRGSLTVSKARINGLVDIRGSIRGSGAQMVNPMIHVIEPLQLSGNVSLRNVKIVETFGARDLTRSKGKTFYEIVSNAVPLNADRIPVHCKFRDDKVSWENMTMLNFPYKWLTKRNEGHVVITGAKRATKPTLSLEKLSTENLPIPRLPMRLCSADVISEAIWESNLTVDQAVAKSVKSVRVFEQSELSKFYFDGATSFDEIPWNLKNFTGQVKVKEAHIHSIVDMDYRGFRNSMEKWVEPGRLKGPITVPNLTVQRLNTTMGLVIPLPIEVGNVVARKNFHVDKLNNVDFKEFLENVVKLGDTVSLTNVTFAGSLIANEIFAKQTSFSLQEDLNSGNLGSKEIIGTLESEAMIVPHVFEFQSEHVSVNIIANGNVRFEKEPKITRVNEKNLNELYNEVWLTDRATVVTTEFMEFETVSFESELTLLKSFDTPNLGPWADIENRILSKTKPQSINVNAVFNSMEAPSVIGAAKSRLLSNISYLHDLENNSLKKNSEQVITSSWNIDELTITGNCESFGRVNGLNFAKDVARYDVERNVITGKKIILGDLTARNIDGLKFDEFARDALRTNNGDRTIVVKGWKNFETLDIRDLRVEGKIMGRRTDELLLKSTSQNFAKKIFFQGSLKAPAVTTNGTINGVNLKRLVGGQLKKRATLQIIESPMTLANNLTIFGNMTIDGLYEGVDLTKLQNFEISQTVLNSVVRDTSEIMRFAEGIDFALANRANYWDRLELIENNSTAFIPPVQTDKFVELNELGRCVVRGSSLYFNEQKIFDASSAAENGSDVVRAEVFAVSGIPLVASIIKYPGETPFVPSDGISVSRYIVDENRFEFIAGLTIPGIVEGFVETMTNSLWFGLRLRDDTMIVRYELWSSTFRQWIIPGGQAFIMSSTPDDELLIIRQDGIWRLGGLAGPRRIFRADLRGRIDAFTFDNDYYVQLRNDDVASLLKPRYFGN